MVKMYRSPQALRSFARIFTLLLPPFYAPTFAQVAREVNSVTVGVLFGIITAVGLTALFESLQVLEDPFTAFLALDGIDVREEFEVLHFCQLVNTRRLVFPDAPAYPPGRRSALTTKSKVNRLLLGKPPHSPRTKIPSVVGLASLDTNMNTNTPLQDEDGESSVVDLVSPWDWEHLDGELGAPLDPDDDNASVIRESYLVDTTDTTKERSRALSGSASVRSMSRRFLMTPTPSRHTERQEMEQEDDL
jgi:hypothetical protein